MPRLSGLPLPETIKALRGKVDFYVWRGIVCAKTWPRKPTMPRSPPSAASAQAFAQFSRDLSETSSDYRDAARVTAEGQPWTWKDVLTRAGYGRLIEWETVAPPPPPPEEVDVLAIRLQCTDNYAVETIPVNNVNYIRRDVMTHKVDFSEIAYTHFRIVAYAGTTQGGQTVTLQLSHEAPPFNPVSAAGNDLALTFAAKKEDSGWIEIDPTLDADTWLTLALKGSNATVDMWTIWTEIQYKKQ